jgi:hypothetical protein
MHPIHDVDVILLLATTLASKRRPAELADIIAAAELIQETIPSEAKLGESFARLTARGLLTEHAGRFALSTAAEQIMSGQRRKADTAERVFAVRQKLVDYQPAVASAPVQPTPEQLRTAVLAHRAAARSAAGNQLMPKPKAPVEAPKRMNQSRKAGGAPRVRKV